MLTEAILYNNEAKKPPGLEYKKWGNVGTKS